MGELSKGIFKAIFGSKFVKTSLIGIAGAAVFAVGAAIVGMPSGEFKSAVCGAPAVEQAPAPKVKELPATYKVSPEIDEEFEKLMDSEK